MTRFLMLVLCAVLIGYVRADSESYEESSSFVESKSKHEESEYVSEECYEPEVTEAPTTTTTIKPDCPVCGKNEILDKCPADCPSQKCPKSEQEANQPQLCTKPDVCPPPACICEFNHRRDDNGSCIPTEDCPPFACSGPNEEFHPCPPWCPTDDCSQASPDGTCPKRFGRIGVRLICSPKCRCKKGFWRKNGICRPYADCDIECNAPNEEYIQDKRSCPPEECFSLVARIDCRNQTTIKSGCGCKPGFLRVKSNTPCVPICKCPQMKYSPECRKPVKCPGPFEEYVLEKQTCPPQECWAMTARINCTGAPPPEPGCACKDGYMRLNATEPCMETCKCPEMMHSPECKKPVQKCLDPNEEYVLEKSTCPGDECRSITARVDCTTTPTPPQPGCRCKEGFYRLNATSQCVDMCQCPEMKYTPRCNGTAGGECD